MPIGEQVACGDLQRVVMVAAEFALGVVLLFATTLFVRSYVEMQSVDVGYPADHVFTASVSRRAWGRGRDPRIDPPHGDRA